MEYEVERSFKKNEIIFGTYTDWGDCGLVKTKTNIMFKLGDMKFSDLGDRDFTETRVKKNIRPQNGFGECLYLGLSDVVLAQIEGIVRYINTVAADIDDICDEDHNPNVYPEEAEQLRNVQSKLVDRAWYEIKRKISLDYDTRKSIDECYKRTEEYKKAALEHARKNFNEAKTELNKLLTEVRDNGGQPVRRKIILSEQDD